MQFATPTLPILRVAAALRHVLVVAATAFVMLGCDVESEGQERLRLACEQHEEDGCGIAASSCYDRVGLVAGCENCQEELYATIECQAEFGCDDPACGGSDPWPTWFACSCE
ncbi:MAG: hypothetical protein AAGF92_02030 [Myxococcota bacterium]